MPSPSAAQIDGSRMARPWMLMPITRCHGLRPALTPTAGDTGTHRSGAGNKEDQQNKIHLTEVSTVSGDCHCTSGLLKHSFTSITP
jgi:hypothetical protein